MDPLLVNLRLAGAIDDDLSRPGDQVEFARAPIGPPLSADDSVFGKEPFETGTDVHAAAVFEAFPKGDQATPRWLAEDELLSAAGVKNPLAKRR